MDACRIKLVWANGRKGTLCANLNHSLSDFCQVLNELSGNENDSIWAGGRAFSVRSDGRSTLRELGVSKVWK